MEKILVAVDGSDNSKRALVEAKRYAQHLNAKITIVNVAKNLMQYASTGYQTLTVEQALKDEAEKVLEKALEVFGDFQGEIDTKLLKGNPADQIIKEADEGDYDLIIMGSRGLGAFSKAILGSISNKVLNHTNKNVLVVK